MSGHRAPYVLLAGLAVTGCGGQQKLARSDTPAAITSAGSQEPVDTTTQPSPSAAKPTATIAGRDVLTKFGDVQVSITLRTGRIVDVQWLKLPLDRPRSQFISEHVSPILRSEVLSAQSAHINVVSGATYTSDAWASSVQSALTQRR